MSTSVPPILQLASTLTLLASGSFQHNAEIDFLLRLAQRTMSKTLSVFGCVDGTHFGFQTPTENEYMFFNRKGFHSQNSMIETLDIQQSPVG
ncbi:hypothetical protein DOY81_008141 [Sarcophaga bullata]|nr:hypothetical protein DOY81_008141 [Sarcophaga bullata]